MRKRFRKALKMEKLVYDKFIIMRNIFKSNLQENLF